MIEDALKSTRNIERLLLAVSIVALVFVLSIESASRQKRLLEDLRKLSSLASEDYRLAVGVAVDDWAAGKFAPTRKDFERELDAALEEENLQILGTSRIIEVLFQPAHVGRLRPEDLRFASDDVTLRELDQLFGHLPLARDLQLVLADTSGFLPHLVAFIDDAVPPGPLGLRIARLENVELYPLDDPTGAVDTFLADDIDTTTLILSFEVHPDSGGVLPSVSNLQLPGRFEKVPDLSFLDWLSSHSELSALAGRVDDRWRWLPRQQLSDKERSTELGELRKQLRDEIHDTKAANQVIDLPGVKVPGELALAAIPLTFLALLWIYLSHLHHLRRLVADHRDTFRDFAWPSLTDRAPFWPVLTVLPILVLPLSTLLFLAWRADAFDVPLPLSLTICAVASLALAGLGLRVLQQLRLLRKAIWSKENQS